MTYNNTKTKTADETTKEMLTLWAQKIPGEVPALTHQRKTALDELFRTIFNSDLDAWTNFVSLITESDFLMGKISTFKITLDWVLTPEHCLTILDGVYANEDAAMPTPAQVAALVAEKNQRRRK